MPITFWIFRVALPCTCASKRMQALTALVRPFASVSATVHAPQSPSLQPSFVPVLDRESRSQSSRVCVAEGFGIDWVSPFRRNVISMYIACRGTGARGAVQMPDAA